MSTRTVRRLAQPAVVFRAGTQPAHNSSRADLGRSFRPGKPGRNEATEISRDEGHVTRGNDYKAEEEKAAGVCVFN
jgi:hypothetical protein